MNQSETTDPAELRCQACENIQERANDYADYYGHPRQVRRCDERSEDEEAAAIAANEETPNGNL